MRTRALLVLVSGILLACSLSASSARAIHPQLVGVKAVALNFSPQTVPGLNTDALEKDIRQRLQAANLNVDSSAPIVLFVQITYRQLPACADVLLVRTHIALSEDAVIRRGNRSETVHVDTWKEAEELVEPVGKAAEVARSSVLGLISYFLEARDYTTFVLEKKR